MVGSADASAGIIALISRDEEGDRRQSGDAKKLPPPNLENAQSPGRAAAIPPCCGGGERVGGWGRSPSPPYIAYRKFGSGVTQSRELIFREGTGDTPVDLSGAIFADFRYTDYSFSEIDAMRLQVNGIAYDRPTGLNVTLLIEVE